MIFSRPRRAELRREHRRSKPAKRVASSGPCENESERTERQRQVAKVVEILKERSQ